MPATAYSERPCELFEAAVIDEPDSLFARLRSESPIARVGETGVHLVATWALIDEALRREDDFSANLTGVLMQGEGGQPAVFELGQLGASQVIATADEPVHAVHRALVQPRLMPAQTAALESRVRAWAAAAIEPWVEARGGDFVPIAELVPARVVAHLLGLPDGDVSRHRAWAMMGGDILAGAIDARQLVALATETGRMAEYLGQHFDAAQPSDADDPSATLLGVLAGGVERGEIERQEAIGIAIVMFGAGGESTAGLIGSVVRRLAADAQMADRLRHEPEAIPRFVEEVARLDPPFKFHYRAVRRACVLGGVELAPGDRLMLLWASANRDAAMFEAPDTLRLDRRHSKRHMSFGRGNHFCVGAPLARLEARVVAEELLARTSRIGFARGDAAVYARSIFVRRFERLPLEVERAG